MTKCENHSGATRGKKAEENIRNFNQEFLWFHIAAPPGWQPGCFQNPWLLPAIIKLKIVQTLGTSLQNCCKARTQQKRNPTTSTNTVLVCLPNSGVESLSGKVHTWRGQQHTQLQSYICFLESHTVNANILSMAMVQYIIPQKHTAIPFAAVFHWKLLYLTCSVSKSIPDCSTKNIASSTQSLKWK